MSDSFSERLRSTPVRSLDGLRPQMAKAVHGGPSAWTVILKDALIRHYGSLKAAAISMGEYDESQLTRDLASGKFRFERLEHCDESARAFIASAFADAYGHLEDPAARVRRSIRDARRALDEVEQHLEFVRSA